DHGRTDYTRADGHYGPSGMIFRRSQITIAEVTAGKGSSNQYMIGEKFLRTDKYEPGGSAGVSDGGDNECMYAGHDNDTNRTSFYAPTRDHPPPFVFVDGAAKGNNETFRFGSAHPAGFHMAMGDGSVHHISYSIDPNVFP